MARRRHRHAAAEIEPDDSVGLAGWLYTDLLLGLAVIFLGSIAVLIPAITDEEATAATTTTTTTEVVETTTTIPVKLCTALYVPAQEERDGIYMELPDYLSGQALVDRFMESLRQQLDEENAKPEMADKQIKMEELKLGLIISKGGARNAASGGQAQDRAKELLARLRAAMPDLFANTPTRFGYSTKVPEGYAYLEILPLVEREC